VEDRVVQIFHPSFSAIYKKVTPLESSNSGGFCFDILFLATPWISTNPQKNIPGIGPPGMLIFKGSPAGLTVGFTFNPKKFYSCKTPLNIKSVLVPWLCAAVF
jgi:hypothetical protein